MTLRWSQYFAKMGRTKDWVIQHEEEREYLEYYPGIEDVLSRYHDAVEYSAAEYLLVKLDQTCLSDWECRDIYNELMGPLSKQRYRQIQNLINQNMVCPIASGNNYLIGDITRKLNRIR